MAHLGEARVSSKQLTELTGFRSKCVVSGPFAVSFFQISVTNDMENQTEVVLKIFSNPVTLHQVPANVMNRELLNCLALDLTFWLAVNMWLYYCFLLEGRLSRE